jgi:hypothetical protein
MNIMMISEKVHYRTGVDIEISDVFTWDVFQYNLGSVEHASTLMKSNIISWLNSY